MGPPKWLTDYYGRDFDLLNPEVVMEGESASPSSSTP
jgi:hypothetical protein